MNLYIVLWLAVGTSLLIVIIEKFRRVRPCWFFGHAKKYVRVDNNLFYTKGRCNDPGHRIHIHSTFERDWYILHCYVARWICTECPSAGDECLGDVREGAWKVEHGKIIPDEKEWASRPFSKKDFAKKIGESL